MSEKVLVFNCGSSSIKYQLYNMPEGDVLAKGLVEKIGDSSGAYKHSGPGGQSSAEVPVADHGAGLDLIIELLTGGDQPAVADLSEIKACGHRVVHGGEKFSGSVIINDQVKKTIEDYFDLAPLHNPPNLTGITAAESHLPGVPQVACFDTAFHSTIPEVAYMYGLPYDLYEKYRIRRYGFHGTSHRYVARRCSELLKQDKYQLNAITCHLGNGCSMAAVAAGKSVDTTMGLTPLEGLVMGTRSGDLDPAIVFYLASKPEYANVKDIDKLLNKQSGLLGISGVSNDVRTLLESEAQGNSRAKLALDIFVYRIRKYIGCYAAALPKLDAIIFTGGIGENAAPLRARIVEGLGANLGVELDGVANDKTIGGLEGDVSSSGSTIKLMVIPTNEEKAIAADTYQMTVGSK
jgi:acetate kinase